MLKSTSGMAGVAGYLLISNAYGCSSDATQGFSGVASRYESLSAGADQPGEVDLAAAEILVEIPAETASGPITLVKYLDRAGDLQLGVRTEVGVRPVERLTDLLVQKEEPIIGDALASAVAESRTAGEDRLLSVVVSMREASERADSPREMLSGTGTTVLLNGKEITQDEVRQLNLDRISSQNARASAQLEQRVDLLSELAQREGWKWSRETTEKAAAEGELIELELRASEVDRFVDANRDIVGAVDLLLPVQGASMSTMMNATWIDTFTLTGAHALGQDGDGVVVYMTELNCRENYGSDPYFNYDNYARLSGQCVETSTDPAVIDSCDHTWLTTRTLQTVAPNASILCRANGSNNVLPTSSDLSITQIISISAGSFSTTQYTSTDKAWDNVAWFNNELVFIAAGNTGSGQSPDGRIATPAKGLNVVTVGNYQDNTTPYSINPTSCWYDPTDSHNHKPELSAPGTGLDFNPTYGFVPFPSGTSFSTPHAAGFAADLMEALPTLAYRPWLAKAWLMASAMDTVTGGYDKVGMGGITYDYAHDGGAWWEWDGNKSDWSYFDSVDAFPNNNRIDTTVYLSSAYSKVNVVVVWLTRPDWTYAHRTMPIVIGMDIDMQILKPDGSIQANLFTVSDGFEHYSFDPTVSGTYHIKLNTPDWDDNSNGIYMGLGVQWL